MAEDGFARHHLGRAGGHLTVVIGAVHQQFVTAGARAAADYDCTRVEPVFDLGVDRDAQLRARWREEY
jgi:3-keto-L-gulonate-6-phosphate decarboxylase